MAGKMETMPIRQVEAKESMAIQKSIGYEDAVLLGDFNFRSELGEVHKELEDSYEWIVLELD